MGTEPESSPMSAETQRGEVGEPVNLAFAWEALARAHVVAGDRPQATRSLARARELTDAIAEDEDREIVLADLADLDARLAPKG